MPPTRSSNPKKRKSNGGNSQSNSSDKRNHDVNKTAELEAALAEAKRQNEKLLVAASASAKADANINDAILMLVRNLIKGDLWREIKFINGDEQQVRFGKKIYKRLGRDVSHIDMDEFVATYAKIAVTTLNQFRQYIMNRLGEAVFVWADIDGNKDEFPKSSDLLKCLKRNINPNKPEEMHLFKWYWDEFLPNSTGSKSFAPHHRHFAEISKAAPLGEPDKIFMTPECEAFAVLTYENYRNKYIAYKAYKAQYPKLKLLPCIYHKGSKTVGKLGTVEESGRFLRVYGGGKGKYTRADVGQCHFGGWEKPGLERYKVLRKLSYAARKTEKCAILESASLAEVRRDLGITAATHSEHIARPRPASVPNNADIDCGGLDSDVEDEDVDIELDDEDENESDVPDGQPV